MWFFCHVLVSGAERGEGGMRRHKEAREASPLAESIQTDPEPRLPYIDGNGASRQHTSSPSEKRKEESKGRIGEAEKR